MKTGHELGQNPAARSHKMAIVTGATSVFMRELSRDMMKLHVLTGDDDMSGIAAACAARLLQSQRCAELEAIVETVLDHEDGMPEIANTALLAEILACYSDAARAERTGTAATNRRETLIPAIVEQSMPQDPIGEDEATRFVNSINEYNQTWEAYMPSTPFQMIICNAINKLVA